MHIQLDEILFNKAAIIERCISRIHDEYQASPNLDNHTHVDAMTLNIERACQATVDIANHIIAVHHLSIPQSTANAFEILRSVQVIDQTLLESLKAMTGFRNIAVHQYQQLNLDILRYIAKEGYKDFIAFCNQIGIDIKG